MNKLRNLLIVGALTGFILTPTISEAGVRVYIRIGPPKIKRVKVVKPVRPCRNSIWVAGHYKILNGRYAWVKGHYLKARPGYVYVQPRLVKTARGYYFVKGRYVKKV